LKTIWKYPLLNSTEHGRLTDRPVIDMPRGAQPLDVQMQGALPHVWALVDDTAPREPRQFVIVGTGDNAAGVGRHVGTWQQAGYVFHLFEAPQAEINLGAKR
jgi:hypothetical protein